MLGARTIVQIESFLYYLIFALQFVQLDIRQMQIESESADEPESYLGVSYESSVVTCELSC